jgi:hypothetical protein
VCSSEMFVVRLILSSRLLRQQQDIAGMKRFHVQNLKSHVMYDLHCKIGVEHMVMQTSMLNVAHGSAPERFQITGSGVEAEIMQTQYLIQMCEIVFPRSLLEILNQMRQRRDRPAVIECTVAVRQYENKNAADLENATPFLQRLQGVRNVLQRMRGQQEIIRTRRDLAKVRGFGYELLPGRAASAITEGVPWLDLTFPNRLVPKVTIVDPGGGRIHRYRPLAPEHVAWAADLESDLSPNQGPA